MELRFVQVDAFASTPFAGNPAAVVVLDEPLDDATLQAIAVENNLSETAFLRFQSPGEYGLRWFTPTVEVDLCGHATLASGHVVLPPEDGDAEVGFETRSGRLVVRRVGDAIEMALPSIPPFATDVPTAVTEALGAAPVEVLAMREVHHASYYLARFETVAEIDALTPDFRALGAVPANVVCTAPGESVDFVSRFFGPASGVDEDPVTGSAHCSLAPYWAERLDRSELTAEQRSKRGGHVRCRMDGDRVWLAGPCVTVITGTLHLPR